MGDKPKVSVLMPVHNGGRFVRLAVKSILKQTYSDFELLIVDDGSDDETPDVLAQLAKQDSRICVLRNPKKMGLGWTLNLGVQAARGEWVARMDADDVSHPERLGRQLAAVQDDPSIDVIGTQAVDIDADGKPVGLRSVPLTHEAIRAVLPWANPMIHPSVLFRRRAVISVGSYDPNLTNVEDYDLWFRCVAGGLKLANLPDVLLGYRIVRAPYARRGWRYRVTETQVRWKGYRALGCSPLERTGVFVPLILSLIRHAPEKLADVIYEIGKKVDPRRAPYSDFPEPGKWLLE